MSRCSIVAICAVALVLVACDQKSETPKDGVRPLMSVVVQPRPTARLQLAGLVQPRIQTNLGFRVLGRLVARQVGVGDILTKGQVIAAIDPLTLELAVRSSQADLSNSQAQRANASTTAERQQALADAKSGSEAALESAQQAQKTASASVAKAQANLAKAEEQLGYAQLKAEFDGVVTATSAEVGQVVSAGQTVLTVARPELRDVVVDIPETQMQGMRMGSPFEITLQLDQTIRASGTVREIAPEADAATRTQRVKIGLGSPPPTFRLGSIVTATSTTDASPTISVPATAILELDGEQRVWIVDPDKKTVSLRKVRIADAADDANPVVVVSGLKAGDRVAVAGVNELAEGQQVRINQEATP
jgi:RND family efflux transporter MFP subunit